MNEMMRRFALSIVALLALAATAPGLADTVTAAPHAAGVPPSCATTIAAAELLRFIPRRTRGGVQLACSRGCLRRCAAVYRACLARSRDWRRCSAVRRNCIRSCGC